MYVNEVVNSFRAFAGCCGAVEVTDDLAWHLSSYAEAMLSQMSNNDSDKEEEKKVFDL